MPPFPLGRLEVPIDEYMIAYFSLKMKWIFEMCGKCGRDADAKEGRDDAGGGWLREGDGLTIPTAVSQGTGAIRAENLKDFLLSVHLRIGSR